LDFLNAREKGYKRTARSKIGSSQDLVRIHDKFATVYAAGCLAIREKILPFVRNDLLRAIVTCEADHVRFVQDELAGVVQQQLPPIVILRAYIQENRDEFIDLKKLPANHKYESCPGYTNVHAGRPEYLFPVKKLEEIVGSPWAASELKQALYNKGLIATVAAGKGKLRYVVRRIIQGQRTPYLAAIYAEVCEA
jgi:hypothetical protein